jgi:hypothetical protein
MKNVKENITKGITQEDKELLLKDLCARLPYGVMCQVGDGAADGKLVEIDISKEVVKFDVDYYLKAHIDNIKPYLRPMSSMTIEERQDWIKYCKADYDCEFQPEPTFDFESCILSINWLNKNHFDYRDLIQKSLAIEVTEENNPYKE